MPREWRGKVLTIAHEKTGHLGVDKVSAMVSRHFLWPSMQRDIGAHVRGCDVCQRKSKYKPKRAPMVERPVLSEPFEDVAVDTVGPLAKGKGGCRFLLTYVCLATRWPEAVPLRSITSQAVAEALVSIFSKTSIPERMMTDQGSQFCSRTLKQVCGGVLTFDLVYGFRVSTPLEALYYGLHEASYEKMDVCSWVRNMAERLELMRDCAEAKLLKGKESRLRLANKGRVQS